MIGPTNVKTLFTAALVMSLMGLTGCGQRMLKNYSSLAPKTASAERFDSTFRSQNALPQNQPPGTTGWAGHSGFPKARLLQPQFGNELETDLAESPAGNLTGNPVVKSAPATSLPANQPLTTDQPSTVNQPFGGHSLGFTADEVRQRMNEKSQNTNTIDLLPEKQEVWQVLSTSDATTAMAPGSAGATNTNSATAGDSSLSFGDAFSSPTDATTISETSPVAERSVLDRLKGLYGDSETNAKQLFRRNLQRLPNPWNVFREKEEQNTAEPINPELPPFETEAPADEQVASVDQDDSAAIALISAVEAELQDWPRTLSGQPQNPEDYQRRQQDLRLLQLIVGRPAEAIVSIEGMPGPEQEFWQELMLSLAHFRSADQPSREQRLTVTAAQLRSAISHISAEAALRFRRLEICSRINSFGRIEPFPSNEFDPGQPVLLYVELENFGTEMTSRGTRKTQFDAQLQFLHHDSDDAIETIELADIHDEATSQRTDYFQSFELNIPSHLAPGVYRIRIQIRDAVRRKQAEGFVEFQVREPASGT